MGFRILANCSVGLGFSRGGFEAGLALEPDLIGCDAGSSDFGPSPLGTGRDPKSRAAVVRDLEIMIDGARRAGAPLVLGSCGGAGDDPHLEGYIEYVDEICRAQGITRRVAAIRARQAPNEVKLAIREGRVKPLGAVPELTEEEVDASAAMVAMMGAAPIQTALADGAEIVLAGRATDPSIFVGAALLEGFPAGPSWHASKSIDKGYLACTDPSEGSPVMATIDADGFTLTPTKASSRCSVSSVTRLTMHENPNPYSVIQPEGTLVTTDAKYEQLEDGRSVRVTGSEFESHDAVTVKLEGARPAGHRKVLIAGLRDPRLLRELDRFLDAYRDLLREGVRSLGIAESAWSVRFRQYGRDAVLGAIEPDPKRQPHEVGLVIDIVAESEELASTIARRCGPLGSRLDVFGGMGGGGNFAYPFSPNVLDGGEVFEWNVWHTMAVTDGLAPFSIDHLRLGA